MKNLTLLFLSFVLIFSSCQKDEFEPLPEPPNEVVDTIPPINPPIEPVIPDYSEYINSIVGSYPNSKEVCNSVGSYTTPAHIYWYSNTQIKLYIQSLQIIVVGDVQPNNIVKFETQQIYSNQYFGGTLNHLGTLKFWIGKEPIENRFDNMKCELTLRK
jgi:hypothetical protein